MWYLAMKASANGVCIQLFQGIKKKGKIMEWIIMILD